MGDLAFINKIPRLSAITEIHPFEKGDSVLYYRNLGDLNKKKEPSLLTALLIMDC